MKYFMSSQVTSAYFPGQVPIGSYSGHDRVTQEMIIKNMNLF